VSDKKTQLELIDQLSEKLTPVQPLWSPERRAITWVIVHLLFAGSLTFFISPFQISFHQGPFFILEIILWGVSIILAYYFSFLSCVPGALKLNKWFYSLTPLAMLTTLLSAQLFLPPSKSQFSQQVMRGSCEIEIILVSFILLAHIIYLQMKGVIVNQKKSILLSTCSSLFVPATIMHFACTHKAQHILIFHLGPVLLGILLISWFLTKLLRTRYDKAPFLS